MSASLPASETVRQVNGSHGGQAEPNANEVEKKEQRGQREGRGHSTVSELGESSSDSIEPG